MGRNYHCEYCDKRFKDDVKIRQKHLKGQAHQTARREHYAKYKSMGSLLRKKSPYFTDYFAFTGAREILEEESHKRKCAWFQSGYCQFGSACRSSHYTEEQLAELRQQGTIGSLEHFHVIGDTYRTFLFQRLNKNTLNGRNNSRSNTAVQWLKTL